MRGRSCSNQWNLGLDAINSIAVDPAKTVCACAMDSFTMTLLDPASNKVVSRAYARQLKSASLFLLQEWKLEGNHEHILGVVFTSEADGLVSVAHDGTLTVWQ